MKKRSSVVMATTPSEKPTSLFMELIAQTDEKGRPRMHVVRSGQPCGPCSRTKEPWTCVHTLDERPHWKDKGKEERLRYLYVNAADTFAREQLGAIVDDSVRPFLPRYIVDFQQRPPVSDNDPPPCVFLVVDAASGGKCDFAILGVCFRGPVMEVRSHYTYSVSSSSYSSPFTIVSRPSSWWRPAAISFIASCTRLLLPSR